MLRSSDFEARRAAAAAFNGRSAHRKRGLAAIPTKFGISFTTKFLNQGAALVHIYTDGAWVWGLGGGGVGGGVGVPTPVVGPPFSASLFCSAPDGPLPSAAQQARCW